MLKTKRRALVMVAACLLFGMTFAGGSAFAGEHGRRHGGFGHGPMLGMLHRLNLTQPQETQVAAILKGSEAEAKSLALEGANARAELIKAIMSGSDVTAACQGVAASTERSAKFRAGLIGEIKKILTTEQLAVLQKMQDKIGTHANERIDDRFKRLDKWIARHSG